MENEKVSPALFKNGQNFLITSDTWFIAPDGEYYNGAFGPVKIVDAESVLGIKSNARSSNWYAIVGYENQSVCIAGCQIHGAVRTDSVEKDSGTIRDDHKIESTNKARPRVWTPTDVKSPKPIELGEFKFSVDTTGLEKIIDSFGKVKRLFDAYNPPIVKPLSLATPIVVKPDHKTIFPITEYDGPCWSWLNEASVIHELNLWEFMEKRLARNIKGVGIVHPPEVFNVFPVPSYLIEHLENARGRDKKSSHYLDALQYSMYAERFFHSEPSRVKIDKETILNSPMIVIHEPEEQTPTEIIKEFGGHKLDSDLIGLHRIRLPYTQGMSRVAIINVPDARKRLVDLYLAQLSPSEENGLEFSAEIRSNNLEGYFDYINRVVGVNCTSKIPDDKIVDVIRYMREGFYWPFGVDKFINKK